MLCWLWQWHGSWCQGGSVYNSENIAFFNVSILSLHVWNILLSEYLHLSSTAPPFPPAYCFKMHKGQSTRKGAPFKRIHELYWLLYMIVSDCNWLYIVHGTVHVCILNFTATFYYKFSKRFCFNWAAQLLLESPSSVKVRLLIQWLATPTCQDGEGKGFRTAVGEICAPPMSHHSVRAISRSCVFWCWLQVCVSTSAWCYRSASWIDPNTFGGVMRNVSRSWSHSRF